MTILTYPIISIIALAVFGGPSLVRQALFDTRQRDTCGNQPRGLTDRDCAVRGGVKAVSIHLGGCR